MTLGEKIKKLRVENNWTQEKFAEMMGVSAQAVSRW
jgi:transcriptional regulator with XRE-family HTH domain